jgi:two-component system alkaline phosphatase synthesis response regulator PhoP
MSEKILVIEDEPYAAGMVQEFLTRYGFQTIMAIDGLEGLRRLYDAQPDLVLLDIVMPHLDGWDVCRRIREMSTVPIMMVTSRSSADEKIKGLQLGADDYLVKPYNPHELAARIEAVLRRTRMPPPAVNTVLRFAGGDLVIDPDNPVVMFQGRPLDLTRTEHRLLVFLARRPGQILSIPEILKGAWDQDNDVKIDNVKWYIWHIRQRLQDDPAKARFIFTVRGIGYRFTCV